MLDFFKKTLENLYGIRLFDIINSMNGSIKKLSLAIYWHMHQPMYKLNSVYLMPWARLHAVKDYLDMILILEKHPHIKLNINVVPTLIDAIIDYTENGLNDIHSSLTTTPVEQLSGEEKEYILNNFLNGEYENMIFSQPTYRKLFKKKSSHKNIGVDDFSNQEYSDLMALFNLAWIDPSHVDRFPELKPLIAKERGYSLKDRIKIIDIHREIISQIIPTYRKYIQAGRIELTTSPYYHSILPILHDEDIIYETTSTLDNLPAVIDFEEDACRQIEMAINKIVNVFGVKPRAIWPSELCLSTKVLDLLIDMGIEWTISDESILSKTINQEFVRDFRGNLEDPYHLLKIYQYKKKKNKINIIFRDSSIPSLINFEYGSMDSKVAAEDLYNKIKIIQSKLLISPDKNHLLTIALDGENCWERYKNDGADFLNRFYSLITKDSSLETVKISDYMDKNDARKTIDGISSGSWTTKDFSFWIGEPTKNLAWDYLIKTRQDIMELNRNNPQGNFEQALHEIYIAEGSDWFWWYGEPNNSGQDNVFDFLFREHLKNAYKYMNVAPPEFLDNSVIGTMNDTGSEQIIGVQEDVVFVNSINLIDGPVYKDTKLFDRIDYGYSNDNFFLRLYLNTNFRNIDDFRPQISNFCMYLKRHSKSDVGSNIRFSYNHLFDFPLLHEKYHKELLLTFVGKALYPSYLSTSTVDNGWLNEEFQNISMPINDVVDIMIPFDELGVKKGQRLQFAFLTGINSFAKNFLPKVDALEIIRPKDF